LIHYQIEEQPVDILSKTLNREKFENFGKKLRATEINIKEVVRDNVSL
jgi:hypothetical protein